MMRRLSFAAQAVAFVGLAAAIGILAAEGHGAAAIGCLLFLVGAIGWKMGGLI